ncbi:hypothetical protein LR48_Vigan125s000700 [Vigna angularis]|uniref:Uncharacterized protein n=1 Tax=Phaseolus angularis TaxID=3914 RepID=A0A0L9T4W3_PHAAN|nr:hypothetical protein LR48_Vigan125s000700 [Vigna angularis]
MIFVEREAVRTLETLKRDLDRETRELEKGLTSERERDRVLAGVPPFTVEGRLEEIERLQPVPFDGAAAPTLGARREHDIVWFRPCPGVPRELRRSVAGVWVVRWTKKRGFPGCQSHPHRRQSSLFQPPHLVFTQAVTGYVKDRQAVMCDILWQDSENFVDDGIQIEPFNLDKEREEGYFHAAANFVEYVRENEIKDAWLDNIEFDQKYSALKSVPTNDVDEGMPDLSSKDIAVMKRRIANVLEPGETLGERSPLAGRAISALWTSVHLLDEPPLRAGRASSALRAGRTSSLAVRWAFVIWSTSVRSPGNGRPLAGHRASAQVYFILLSRAGAPSLAPERETLCQIAPGAFSFAPGRETLGRTTSSSRC